jgi:hypothetical protein
MSRLCFAEVAPMARGTGYENMVFGQIKDATWFRPFLLRGLKTVKGACTMLCTAHNLLKIHKAQGQAA